MVSAVFMLGGLGLLVGVGLAVASKVFYVYVDPLILEVGDENGHRIRLDRGRWCACQPPGTHDCDDGHRQRHGSTCNGHGDTDADG